VLLRPVRLFDDPFRGAPNKIALCETFNIDGSPTNTNFRHFAQKIFEQDKEGKYQPNFGVEQEYALMEILGTALKWPLHWPVGGFPAPQGKYYCSAGSKFNRGREIMNQHYKACLAAGVKIYGTNAETMPGQWEFQIGTCSDGLETGDHLWIARYLLLRVSENFGVHITFDPKPISGDWAGSGCHTNFSTLQTREDQDLKSIMEHMEKLKISHERSIQLYGENNNSRLTGKNETQRIDFFDFGLGNRGSSIRIPTATTKKGRGYYEDRRPAANMDPYVVCSSLFVFTCLDHKVIVDLENHYRKFLEHIKTLHL
jgi:glutamine synthetase